MTVEAELLPPRYRDPRLIAQGGMGEVYSATDDTLARTVAIKLLAERYADDEAVRARFTREALAAARLSGESNAVTIFDVGEWNGRPFIVMEYLSGGSLERRLREHGAQPPDRALPWLSEAGRALDAAHAHGIVHRDVKPGNLLLDGEGHVQVGDFGIATAAGLESLTQTGTVLGTAGYLSPEQARGERATPASDVYALGVVAFELLTGERPYPRRSTPAEAAAHVHAPIPSISERDRSLPLRLDPVFERVLAKEPSARYESCGAFVEALGQALEHTTGRLLPPPPTAVTAALRRPGRATRTAPVLLALAALLLLLAAGGAVLATSLADGDRGGRPASSATVPATTAETPPPPTAPPPQPPPSPPPPSGASGAELNDEGFAKMRAGDYAGALPLLEQAVEKLRGTGELTEAYASYNLAFTRFALGRCDGVLELLERSELVQGRRKEIDRLRKAADRRCD